MTDTSAYTPLSPVDGCELCERPGGRLVWNCDDWRVVRVEDPAFPAFFRVISNRHVAEFSGLAPAGRRRCMDLVCAVERALIEHVRPTKVNLAALGNVVPHLHWHVVARFAWDSHFPQPIWGTAQRTLEARAESWLGMCLSDLDDEVARALALA
jgi:diadenosine tetraphosphate (Ap4A) HIT family hydrolase